MKPSATEKATRISADASQGVSGRVPCFWQSGNDDASVSLFYLGTLCSHRGIGTCQPWLGV